MVGLAKPPTWSRWLTAELQSKGPSGGVGDCPWEPPQT